MSTRSRSDPRPRLPGSPRDPADEPLRRWETLVERMIREAQDAGQFDDLPYLNERLPEVDDAAAGDRASAFRLLRNTGFAPAWIEADKAARRLLAERDRLLGRAARTGPLVRSRVRTDLARIVDAYNSSVLELNHEAPTPAQHRNPMDPAAELAALEQLWAEADGAAGRLPRRALR